MPLATSIIKIMTDIKTEAPNITSQTNIERGDGVTLLDRSLHAASDAACIEACIEDGANKKCGSNAEFKDMVSASAFSIAVALTIFNRGLVKPATESQFKAWLSGPGSDQSGQKIPAERLDHARSVFGQFLATRH